MEDLKKYLSIAAKHSFWIISGLILILSSVFFFLTKSELDQAITSRVTALNSSFNTIKTVSGKTSTHPNKYSHDEMERRRDLLNADVDRAWEFQYDRQKRFLTWPAEAFADEKTLQIFDRLRPFEASVPFPLPDKLPPPLDAITRNDRAVYKGYIAPEFPALARMIGSTWKFPLDSASMNPSQGGFAPPPGSGGFTPPGFGTAAAARETKDLVRWSEESQKALATAVLPWFGRATPPDIHEIYYAQEDIWILRGLMDIIAQTNAGANENFQAIVKEIEWIRTGPRVSRDAGSLVTSSSGASGGAPYGAGGAPSGYTGGGGGGMPSGYGGMGGMGGKGGEVANAVRAATRVDPADNRYVDANLKAISGAQLRTAIKDRAKNQDGVAKRVQVRMRVKVDERFGKLITECGNGKMMLEVLQVRYNTDPAPDQGGSGGGGGGGAAGASSKPSFGGAGFGAGGGAGMMSDGEDNFGSTPQQSTEINSGEISIEIYGLIYLFNPPPSLDTTSPATPVPAGSAPAAPAAPAANPPAEAPPAEAPPAEAPPAEAPAGEAPAGEAPAAEAPAAEAPAGEAPAGDTPGGEAPAGETPAAEPPAGQAPAEEEPPANPGTDTNPPPAPPEPSGEGGGGLGS